MVYRMIFNQEAYFGRGAIKNIPEVAKTHGFHKAFIVSDPTLADSRVGTVKKVTDVLEEGGDQVRGFHEREAEPSCGVYPRRGV